MNQEDRDQIVAQLRTQAEEARQQLNQPSQARVWENEGSDRVAAAKAILFLDLADIFQSIRTE